MFVPCSLNTLLFIIDHGILPTNGTLIMKLSDFCLHFSRFQLFPGSQIELSLIYIIFAELIVNIQSISLMIHPTTKLLQDARDKVSFPIKELTKIVYSDEYAYELMMKTQERLDQLPETQNDPNYYNLSRMQQHRTSPVKLQIYRNIIDLDNIDKWFGLISHTNQTVTGGVFYGMVIPILRILGTDEQIKRWEEDFVSLKIICAYVQTELGHGSDVQNLETTATFHPETDEFIIHTPSITATKFWPGDLGIYANWALVYAGLIIDGKKQGVYPFMVPIRDPETNQPLPGIVVGDIGPKLGYNTKDNGFIQFNQVRVPRFNLLNKFAQVERDGSITKHGNQKISYAAMMIIRKILIHSAGLIAGQALTVALRYSIVRQQFRNDQGVENSILEYQSQQDRLLPLLAKQYAIQFGGLYTKALVEENFDRAKKKDYSIFGLTHALLSGSKANFTYFVVECYEWCRLSCGGHGFAHYSGLPGQVFESTPNITLEGENKVMYLQLARFLLKMLQWAQTSPERIPIQFAFLRDVINHPYLFQMQLILTNKISAEAIPELTELNTLAQLLQQNATVALSEAVNIIQKFTSEGLGFKEVWDFRANESLVQAAIAFMEYFNFTIFQQKVQIVEQPQIKLVLTQLCQLYGVHTLLTQCPYLIDGDLITSEQMKALRVAKEGLLPLIKNQAIGLVDAFGFSDNHLKTLIGCYDGKPYERLFEWVQNKNSRNQGPIPKGILDLKTVKPRL